MQKSKWLDVAVLIILPIIASGLTVFFHTNLFISILLFFGIPVIYLTWSNPGIFTKSFIFAFLLSIPLSLFIDAFAAVNGSWVVPESVFPFRFFGAATVEVYIYGLLWVLFAVLFYEHFFDKGKRDDKTSPHIKYLLGISVALLIYSCIAFWVNTSLLHIPYFYFWVGTLLVVIPLILFLIKYPHFIGRYFLVGLYFFFVLFLFEIVALETGQWIFSGEFIGFINVLGHSFPVEELVIWITLATISLLSYYEFFDDDRLPS